jgi:hypothetical protein
MGSVVLRDVPEFETWWGSPAVRHGHDVPTGVESHPIPAG